jgi:hypothetical protein
MEGGKLTKDYLAFILAGNSTVTFKNTETSNRFTFKVVKHKTNDIYFVKALINSEYTYIGYIKNKIYTHSSKSTVNYTETPVKVFAWCLNKIEELPDIIEVWHEGKCGRCGRELTVPESIKSGFGPECIKKLGK